MKSLLQIACLCLLSLCSLAQNVTILPGGITPAGSSWPSLSYEDILALPSPQTGNIAIDITFDCLRLYNGKKWVRLLTETEFNLPTIKAWSGGGSGIDKGKDIAVDVNGNIYVVGNFDNTATFENTALMSSGANDIFIAKYNKNGDLVWIKKEGGANNEEAQAVGVDATGNVFIAGYFHYTVTIGNKSLTSEGIMDFFIAKYDTNGNFKWAKSGGGTSADEINSLVTDVSGNVYAGGVFRNVASFDGTSIVSLGNDDIFLAKYNSSGTLQWVQRAGGTSVDNCKKITIDADNNIYMTGSFYSTAGFGNISLTSNGNSDMFSAKYNTTSATWDWAKRGGGTNAEEGAGIAISPSGNVFVTGTFSGVGDFGNTSFTSIGSTDIFIIKYNNSGEQFNVFREGGKGFDTAEFIGIDANDNFYLIGSFQGEIDFSGNSLNNKGGFADLFITKYKPNSAVQWAQKLGGSGTDGFGGAVLRPDGNVYLTGSFGSDFKSGTVPLIGAGIYDVFIARVKE